MIRTCSHMWRLLAVLGLSVLLANCQTSSLVKTTVYDSPQASPSAHALLSLEPISFSSLSSWNKVDSANAFMAFGKTCHTIAGKIGQKPITYSSYFGTAADWNRICRAYAGYTPSQARNFFETYFMPVRVHPSDTSDQGKFTGYYEPIVHGNYHRSKEYAFPLYAPPTGMKKPSYSRAQIVNGALVGKAKPIMWLNSEIDSFFLHIQGSGRVQLPDGKRVKVAYADQNGHPYYAIGRYLIETGAIPKEQMSARAIKLWLQNNPRQAQNVMNKNPSYVFFNLKYDDANLAAVGAAGVPLTPEYSLAVDRNIYVYGLPMWIETTVTTPHHPKFGQRMAFHRLMIAQDTGGAIKGAVRGDVFFGTGDHAEFMASHLSDSGRKYLLLPKK